MKKLFLSLLLISSSLFASTQKIEVNGMVCAFCAQGIEKGLSKFETTKDVYVNLDEGFVILENKAEAVSEDKIRTIITDSGYDVTKISLINETADEVRKKYENK